MSMTSTDPIADMLTRIRNGIAVQRTEISLPHSNAKEKIAAILVDNGFLAGQSSTELDGQKHLKLVLKNDGENAKISAIARMSKPGQRNYVKSKEIPTVKRGRGIVVISTSGGVMTGSEARSKNLGGELICEVY